MANEWAGKWAWFCRLTIEQLLALTPDDLLLVAQDALDNGVFQFDQGGLKETLSDQGIEYGGKMVAGFVPRLEAIIESARQYKPLLPFVGLVPEME